MALGFKVADGYVEVHARYNKGEVQKAASDAADDHDHAFNKERESNSKSGNTRDTNRQIGRQASDDFVKGMREQIARQKQTPMIKATDVKRDATSLGKVHVQEFGKSADRQVDKDRNVFRRIGQKVGQHIFGKDNAARAATNFFKSFAEAITFGQADFSKPINAGKLTKTFSAIGTTLGVTLATALIAEIGNLITAGLPVVLGLGLAALPIIGLIRTGMTKEHGHWKTELNDMGRALHGLVLDFKSFMKVIEAPLKAPVLTMITTAGASLKTLAPILANIGRALGPSLTDFMTGAFSAIINFVKALEPALPGITAGLHEWATQLPILGTALGKMLATILKDPAKVAQSVRNLFETLRL
ncbi:MAG TPA: hypothetical protein VJW23_00775, partial [Propionibacteriaceae bacterium]|nr:hypothetical protein [Propionibacteriaceae bacterium]